MQTRSGNSIQSVKLAYADRVVKILNVPYSETSWTISHVSIAVGECIPLEKKIDPRAKELIHDLYKKMLSPQKSEIYETYQFIQNDKSQLSLEPMEFLVVKLEKALQEYFNTCETNCVMGCCDFDALEFSEENTLLFKNSNPLFFEIAREQTKNLVSQIQEFIATKKFPYVVGREFIFFTEPAPIVLEKFNEILFALENYS